MGSSNTYQNITPDVFACVEKTSEAEHGTVYTPGNRGTATTNTPVGKVVLDFDYEAGTQTVAYTIAQKPFLVTESEIWNGISSTITGCEKQSSGG